ncbi:hypothetical protein AX16_003800 [Volvariella volvacea WC 439]|nr:hypothetical protein AX16_003800 [Volvariella volvacea WC 439]
MTPNYFPYDNNKVQFPDLYEASVEELQACLDAGRFTSVDLVRAYFTRIEEVNFQGPALRAVLEVNPSALAQAAYLDTERRVRGKRSALHGIPVLLKDNIATVALEGMNTTAGSFSLLGSVVSDDASVVKRLREAGAIVLGKANLSEFGHFRGHIASGWSGRGGQCTSAYFPNADPSGSSSGSGVAASIGLAAVTLGTETDGSIISPSSHNNIVGIKPTVGLTSRVGVIPISAHQDTVGPMTRSVADAAIVLSIIAGKDPNDSFTLAQPDTLPDYTKALNKDALKGKRIGVPRRAFLDNSIIRIDPSVMVAFEEALKTMRSLGATIVDPVGLPSADEIIASRRNEDLVLHVDFKVQLNQWYASLLSNPSGVRSLADLISFNFNEPRERPEGFEDQSILVTAQSTKGRNSAFYEALSMNRDLGQTRGIDFALQAHNLDALVLPSEGFTCTLPAISGYPIVTGSLCFRPESEFLGLLMLFQVPLGFYPEGTAISRAGPQTVHPAPGVPFGLCFLGTAWSEFELIGFAYAYEQKTRTRLTRKAYPAAIPWMQFPTESLNRAAVVPSLACPVAISPVRFVDSLYPEMTLEKATHHLDGGTAVRNETSRYRHNWRLPLILSLILFSLLIYTTPACFSPKAVAKFPDLYEASVEELQAGLDAGHYTSVDLVKAYFARIEEVNLRGPALRAVLELNPSALAQAAILDNERKRTGKRSALHGIPILVKDNIATVASEGMNTTAGSYSLLGSIVPEDAGVVKRLRKAGAILLGKTSLSEFSHYRGELAPGWSGRGGQNAGAYFPNADPSGSSSGSGVAASIGLAAVTLGTETDGSITYPSSHNNVVGIKPTVGLTSRAGVIPIAAHQDTVGPMTRSVTDAALVLSIIAGKDRNDNFTLAQPDKIPDYTKALKKDALKGKRIGVPRHVFLNDSITKNDPSVGVTFEKALKTIKDLGATIVDPADMPSADEMLVSKNESLVMHVEFKVQLNEWYASLLDNPSGVRSLADLIEFNNNNEALERPEGFRDQSILIEAELTKGFNSTYFEALAFDKELGQTRGIDAALKAHNLDALVLPAPGFAPGPAAIAGYPIVIVPLGFYPDDVPIRPAGPQTVYPAPGVPFGLCFLGTAWSEFDLISFAYAYEQKTRTRLARKAYPAAIPRTQLRDVVAGWN